MIALYDGYAYPWDSRFLYVICSGLLAFSAMIKPLGNILSAAPLSLLACLSLQRQFHNQTLMQNELII